MKTRREVPGRKVLRVCVGGGGDRRTSSSLGSDDRRVLKI